MSRQNEGLLGDGELEKFLATCDQYELAFLSVFGREELRRVVTSYVRSEPALILLQTEVREARRLSPEILKSHANVTRIY